VGKLITISFRLPYRFTVSKDRLRTSPSAGGLATALTSYFHGQRGTQPNFDSLHWVGVSDLSKKASEKIANANMVEKDGIIMHPVPLASKTRDHFYDGFCNSILWPLFLYFPSFVVYRKEFFDDYVRVNAIMAKKIVELYEPGDTIWVHDYHWLLLPSLVRESLPNANIGFFLHIPFPSFELYRLLPKPWRYQLLRGVLGSDVVGLQTQDFSRHFIESVNHILPETHTEGDSFILDHRLVLVKSFPISIDYAKFNSASNLPQIKRNVKSIRNKLRGTKILLSVDRLDYTKAIHSRLESFELFLEQNPNFIEKVSYILLMVPTRESIPKYKENKLAVESLISRINGKYNTLGWTPIVYLYQTVDFKRLVSLYSAADIALIVPYRDGMNLVAKEYVACKSEGVLILSETAGSASELDSAILVNSNDRQEVADAIVQALAMSHQEQEKRIARMQRRIKSNNVQRWASDFLNAVHSVNHKTGVEV
jgi:trehalose 6-phosphate synthase/phosphatase